MGPHHQCAAAAGVDVRRGAGHLQRAEAGARNEQGAAEGAGIQPLDTGPQQDRHMAVGFWAGFNAAAELLQCPPFLPSVPFWWPCRIALLSLFLIDFLNVVGLKLSCCCSKSE